MDDYPFVAIRLFDGCVARVDLAPWTTKYEALRKARKIANEYGFRTAAVMSDDRRLAVEPGDVIPLQVK